MKPWSVHRTDNENGSIRYELWKHDQFITAADDDIVPDAKDRIQELADCANTRTPAAPSADEVERVAYQLDVKFGAQLGYHGPDFWRPIARAALSALRSGK